VIDDDELIACPRCYALLSTRVQAPALTQEQVDRLVVTVTAGLSKSGSTLGKLAKPIAWSILKYFHWWIAMPLFYLGFLGLSVYSIKSHLENLTIACISQQFAEHSIRKTFREVAKTRASY
jgi:hypothetical protein